MKHRWSEQELFTYWTITEAEKQLLVQRSDVGRVGFAILLKYFQIEGRFPSKHKDVPKQTIEFIAAQFEDVDADSWLKLSLQGRSYERYRAIIRDYLGFQPATIKDGHRIQAWLTEEIVPEDQTPKHFKTSALDWCQKNKIEPPTDERIISAAIRTFETQFFSETHQALSPISQRALDALLNIVVNDDADTEFSEVISTSIFSNLKSDPSRLGLATVQKKFRNWNLSTSLICQLIYLLILHRKFLNAIDYAHQQNQSRSYAGIRIPFLLVQLIGN